MSAVSELAGIGRTTFYECFDDHAHALEAAKRYAVTELATALEATRTQTGAGTCAQTPGDVRLESLCDEWVRFALERPALMLCALTSGAAASSFVSVVVGEGRRISEGAFASASVSLGVAACAVEVARSRAMAILRGESLNEGSDESLTSTEASGALAAALRLLLR